MRENGDGSSEKGEGRMAAKRHHLSPIRLRSTSLSSCGAAAPAASCQLLVRSL